jgi:hypothetical protein
MAVADRFPGLDGHSFVPFGDYGVVYGGKLGATSLNSCTFALDLTTNEVRRLRCAGAVPYARAFHSAAAVGWKMYVFGGLLAVGVEDVHFNAYNVVANVDALDEATLAKPGSTRKRDGALLPRVTQEKREGTSLHVLDLEGEPTWSQPLTTGTMPPTRANHSAAVYRRTMFVYGGYSVHTTGRSTDEEVKACSLVYGLDLTTHAWFVVEAPHTPAPQRWGSASILSGSVWMFFGGFDPVAEECDQGVYAWHMELGEWRWLPVGADAPPRRTMHTAVRWGTSLIAFGGVGSNGSLPMNDVVALDMINGAWRELETSGSRPLPRSGHTACVIGEEMWVVGGLDHSLQRSARTWALNLRTLAWRTVPTQFNAQDLGNVRGLRPAAVDMLPRSAPRFVVNVVSPAIHRSTGTSTLYNAVQIDDVPVSPGRRQPSPYEMSPQRTSHATLTPSNRYPSHAREDGDDDKRLSALDFMRTDIARTKSVLSNMIESAAARAQRDTTVQDRGEALLSNRGGPRPDHTTAEEASNRLQSEVDARIQRLQDMSLTAHTDAHIHAQGYWRHELDRLSKENEKWRMAVQREHVLMRDNELVYAEPTAAQVATRKLIQSGAPPPRQRHGEPSYLAAANFPHSAGVPPAAVEASDNTYVPLRYAPSGRRFVSPSLVKLGLAPQLGQGRTTEMSTNPRR